MTTFSSSRRFWSESDADHRLQDPFRRDPEPRDLHRAEGWVLALVSSAVLWGLTVGGVLHLVSLVD